MKRIVSIQDVSCIGKCSQTVALPIISAMGIECAVLPTAVLSTHTMFQGFTFRDLTGDLRPVAEHWKKEKFAFDAIYTGYLGSFEQLDIVSEFIDSFRTGSNTVFIDPVMADNGKLYPGFTPDFAVAMGKLCGKADVIVPNLTEAAFMLNRPYIGDQSYTEKDIQELLKALSGLGAKKTVLTGVRFSEKEYGVMGYDSVSGEFFHYYHQHLPASFHGTGDIYSSTAVGGIVRGFSFEKALQIAADYTAECIAVTLKSPDHVCYAVEFERVLPSLIRRLEAEEK